MQVQLCTAAAGAGGAEGPEPRETLGQRGGVLAGLRPLWASGPVSPQRPEALLDFWIVR